MSTSLPALWPAMLAGVALSVAVNIAHDRLRATPSPPSPHARGHATQGLSTRAPERAQPRWGSAEIRDRSAAACKLHSAAGWAKRLGTAPDPKAVARALAASVDPAFRRAAYLGCLDQLR
jgi:hypothetical protein